jgi:hypothetical protein
MIVLCHCHYTPGDICLMEWSVGTQWRFLHHKVLFFLIFKTGGWTQCHLRGFAVPMSCDSNCLCFYCDIECTAWRFPLRFKYYKFSSFPPIISGWNLGMGTVLVHFLILMKLVCSGGIEPRCLIQARQLSTLSCTLYPILFSVCWNKVFCLKSTLTVQQAWTSQSISFTSGPVNIHLSIPWVIIPELCVLKVMLCYFCGCCIS